MWLEMIVGQKEHAVHFNMYAVLLQSKNFHLFSFSVHKCAKEFILSEPS